MQMRKLRPRGAMPGNRASGEPEGQGSRELLQAHAGPPLPLPLLALRGAAGGVRSSQSPSPSPSPASGGHRRGSPSIGPALGIPTAGWHPGQRPLPQWPPSIWARAAAVKECQQEGEGAMSPHCPLAPQPWRMGLHPPRGHSLSSTLFSRVPGCHLSRGCPERASGRLAGSLAREGTPSSLGRQQGLWRWVKVEGAAGTSVTGLIQAQDGKRAVLSAWGLDLSWGTTGTGQNMGIGQEQSWVQTHHPLGRGPPEQPPPLPPPTQPSRDQAASRHVVKDTLYC